MMTQSKILVVGSGGFIARHLIAALVKNQNRVYGIQNKTVPPNGSIQTLNIDLLDQNQCNQISQFRFDYIFNMAGYIDHRPYFSMGQSVFAQHFTLVKHLVDHLDWSTIKGFVQVGSSDEYGSHLSPQHEELRERSFSPYSCGKTLSTHFLQMLACSENLPISIARLFLVYGPGQKTNRFLPGIIHACLNSKTFDSSFGEQQRDFLYVDDAVRALISMACIQRANGNIYNIASGVPITIKEVIQKVICLVGSGSANYGAIPYRKGENMSLYAKIEKAKQHMNWQPMIALDIGLKKTISSYAEHIFHHGQY